MAEVDGKVQMKLANNEFLSALQAIVFDEDGMIRSGNIFWGLSRQEFQAKLDEILIKVYNFPRTVDDIFQDPALLLIIAVVCVAIAFLIILTSLRGNRSKKLQVDHQSDESSRNSTKASPSNIPRPSNIVISEAPASPQKSVNTEIDVEEFMNRLFATGFVVMRHKHSNVIKSRCLKLNDQCDLCIFKQFKQKNRVIQPTGGPYIRIPLRELRDCFPCEGSSPPTFILDFANKTIQISAEFVLDNHYLVKGFQGLLRNMKADSSCLKNWSQRFQQRLATTRAIKSKNSASSSSFYLFSSPNKGQMDDDDLRSVSTINTMVTR